MYCPIKKLPKQLRNGNLIVNKYVCLFFACMLVCLSQVDLAGPFEARQWDSGRVDAAATVGLAALAFPHIKVQEY